MRARTLATILIALLLAGCAGKEEFESLRRRLQADEEVLVFERQKNDAARIELQAAISRLENKLTAMENEKAAVVQLLAERTTELERKAEEANQLRKQAELQKKTAEDQQRQQALEAVRKANQPADHPFRVFDVLFVGIFWLAALWLAANATGQTFFEILGSVSGPMLLLYAVFVFLYFFLFKFFLGETLGDRLFRPRE
ncbi:MAG: hypothetical protein HGA94_03795 [Candidatus Aminicenantes bacterium]|nr:hypothetical protein [Candidatus Aminicenantes bacterium]